MQTRSFYSWTDSSELRRVALYPKTAIVSVLPLPLIELSPTLARAITAFAASNLDDILVLVLLFSVLVDAVVVRVALLVSVRLPLQSWCTCG